MDWDRNKKIWTEILIFIIILVCILFFYPRKEYISCCPGGGHEVQIIDPQSFQYQIVIDKVYCDDRNTIFLMNLGNDEIPTNEISIYIDNVLENPNDISWSEDTMSIGGILVSATPTTNISGKVIKVSILDKNNKIISRSYHCIRQSD